MFTLKPCRSFHQYLAPVFILVKKTMKTQILALLAFLFFSQGLMAQEKVKDFTLPAVGDEKPFVLSEAKGKYVALHFLLKTECPYCIRHTNEYVEETAGLKDVVQVFIKPDSDAEIKEWAENLEEDSFTIYRDIDAQLADELGVGALSSFDFDRPRWKRSL